MSVKQTVSQTGDFPQVDDQLNRQSVKPATGLTVKNSG
jgi:hypothetical protein